MGLCRARPGHNPADPVVIDAPRRCSRAVLDVFDRPVIGQLPTPQDPERPRSAASSCLGSMVAPDAPGLPRPSALAAEAELTVLAAELDKTHPGAASSLREGLAETLTVLRLGVAPTLARTLRSDEYRESMIPICREHSANVKRWRRANGAALVRRGDGRGRQAVPPRQRPPAPAALRTALEAEVTNTVTRAEIRRRRK